MYETIVALCCLVTIIINGEKLDRKYYIWNPCIYQIVPDITGIRFEYGIRPMFYNIFQYTVIK